ncbi:NnrS family protein [Rhodanobacter sp. 115]|uniref:NnrS family protein n=1 Tax=Rhodanobacter sp. FW021-MT20 TaxID=1162282 RepID=UPI000260CE9A|nr:NnrS family protein [Rhodanobacter sp. 115]EIL86987.1 NnrS family protein [Rhodanobacter sp. 115]
MSEPLSTASANAALSRLLAAAPHRPLFLAGTVAVLLSMTWWTLELASLRFGWGHWPQPPIPPIWGHAMLIQYGLFPLFMFGFLMTTFPRWMNGPTVPPARYLPVAGGVLGGYVLANIGLLGLPWLLKLGMGLMLVGYVIGVATLGGVLRAATERNKHGWSCFAAFCCGTLGLLLFLGWLLLGAPTSCAELAVKLGTFGFLLPVYFTVCHRMLPFFSNNIAKGRGYVMRRPGWSLPVVWALLLVHLLLDWRGQLRWLWLCDVPLALVFGWHALAWQPWKCMRPGLLAVLHIAFAWLPLAFVLFSIQDIVLATGGGYVLGRAPLHALAIGFFGSMLVAMVTRVTHGHSGRPLQMGAVPWLCFGLLQAVALLRIRAELGGDMYLWLVIAGAGWLLAFLPWVLRSAWIYLTPRADGKPG